MALAMEVPVVSITPLASALVDVDKAKFPRISKLLTVSSGLLTGWLNCVVATLTPGPSIDVRTDGMEFCRYVVGDNEAENGRTPLSNDAVRVSGLY